MESLDRKYITFKREDFERWCIPTTLQAAEKLALPDAVVIRRQDWFASPALASYAASIAIAAKYTTNEDERKGLLQVADYFEDQAKLAAEEGHKLPD